MCSSGLKHEFHDGRGLVFFATNNASVICGQSCSFSYSFIHSTQMYLVLCYLPDMNTDPNRN